MLASACLPKRLLRPRYHVILHDAQPKRQGFHTTAPKSEQRNHYETLGVAPNATDKEIKKQFYALSKSHHPDLHPDDPNASERFTEISEAYATLSSATKRSKYDRDVMRTTQPAPSYPSGSFSSSSTPAGGRPASGLSRRRTQFRGPPPSFYDNGGWGRQGAKRADHASRPSHAWEQASKSAAGEEHDSGMPGVGPGGFAHGLENDVPHFNSRGHYETHSTIERTRHRARRRVVRAQESSGNVEGVRVGYFGVATVLLAAAGIGTILSGLMAPSPRPSKDAEKVP